jgi:hypothetical protein
MRVFGKFSRLGAAAAGVVLGVGVLWAQPALAAPTMTVSPTSGPAGSNFSVTGTECPEIGAAAVGRDSNANNSIDEGEDLDVDGAQANGNGTWTVSLTVPSGTATGALLVEGACVAYYQGGEFQYPDASFTVTGAPSNTLTVDDNTVAPGQTINLQGPGYRPGSNASGVLFSDPVVLGSAVADSSGVVRLAVTIPANTTSGTHRIELQGVDGAGAARVLSANITVSRSGTLPRTGSSTPLRAVAFVGTFTIAGGLAVVAMRRMRADPLWPI